MNGLFIAFEGADGSGKSTQAELLSNALSACGRLVVRTREPGGTQIGDKIRGILTDKSNSAMRDVTELFLYAAARSQIVYEVIRPALERGSVVVCDRFTDSTVAYQAHARGLSESMIDCINLYATDGLSPHAVIFLDVPPETASERNRNKPQDRLESEGLAFQKKVYEGYKAIANTRQNFFVINGLDEPAVIHNHIMEVLSPYLQLQ